MIINIAIVDDDNQYHDKLNEYLEKYSKENNIKFKVDHFSDGDEIVEKYNASYDIIFMDIQMRFLDGMKAAQSIREKDTKVNIIFVTITDQYAIKGYEVNALDYLLKPLNYTAFYRTMNKAIEKIDNNIKYLTLNIKGNSLRISLKDIYYLESLDHNLIFFTKKEEYMIFASMKEYEELLKDDHFFRCNRGILVNLTHVEGIEDDYVIVNGIKLAISRARKKDLKEALIKYWGVS